jgi:FtsZ-binding cell division protein ZapB
VPEKITAKPCRSPASRSFGAIRSHFSNLIAAMAQDHEAEVKAAYDTISNLRAVIELKDKMIKGRDETITLLEGQIADLKPKETTEG